jgi:hypothetical protein
VPDKTPTSHTLHPIEKEIEKQKLLRAPDLFPTRFMQQRGSANNAQVIYLQSGVL